MTARIGDKIIIMSQALHEPVREGEIREIRDGPDGVVYLVWWSDTGYESALRPGPDVVIRHLHSRRSGALAAVATRWLSRLRHPLASRHSRDPARGHQAGDELLAWNVQDVIAGLGLTHTDFSIGGGRTVHHPEVVSVSAGPPVGVHIRMLPGQVPDDFAAHAPAIAYNLGVDQVRVVPLGPSRIRLDLLPRESLPGASSGGAVTTGR